MTGAPPVLRSLHVAAMPFPSPQGTQAAVRAMVEAVAEHGGETTLVTYPYGTRPAGPFPFRWLRLRDVPRVRSMRSGPSLGKIALDAQLVHRLRAWTRRMRPDLVVAHHVEAAAAAVMAGTRPVIYAAHTALGPELPAYLPRVLAPAGAAAGRILERWVARSASAVAAIAPALDHHLRALGVGHVHAWPLPWRVPSPLARPERERARRALGLDPAGEVGLYTGNLDAYQGWRALVGALTRPGAARARLLVATASDPAPLWAEARQAGVAERITVAGLADEAARRAAHAAADLALVPRRIPGGIPVKLLDALARGVPTVATPAATAGLALDGVALVAEGHDTDALAAAWARARAIGPALAELGAAGRAHVAEHHHPDRFVAAFEDTASCLWKGRACPGSSPSP